MQLIVTHLLLLLLRFGLLLPLLPGLGGEVVLQEVVVGVDLAIGGKIGVVEALTGREGILKQLVVEVGLDGHQRFLQIQ
jgi:hypothetical protein